VHLRFAEESGVSGGKAVELLHVYDR
jgi:hypothetical protein